MLIASKIERKGGSCITISGTEYHFLPTPPTGAHLCEVENEDHAKRLLAITEGFYAVEGEVKALSAEDALAKAEADAAAAETAAVAAAIDASTAAIDASNAEISAAEAVDTDNGEGEAEAEEGEGAPEGDSLAYLEDLSDIDLKQAYKDVFGKKPNGQMLRENIIKSIRENAKD